LFLKVWPQFWPKILKKKSSERYNTLCPWTFFLRCLKHFTQNQLSKQLLMWFVIFKSSQAFKKSGKIRIYQKCPSWCVVMFSDFLAPLS
jgi:hypothetical protein